MTPALAYTRALLDQPPPALIPGQLAVPDPPHPQRTDQEHPVPAYTEPADRPDEWAAMATEMAAAGHTTTEIAAALWIDEPTVINLLLPPLGQAA